MEDMILMVSYDLRLRNPGLLSLELWDSGSQSKETFITAAGEIRPSSVKIELNQILWVHVVLLILCRFIVLLGFVYFIYICVHTVYNG